MTDSDWSDNSDILTPLKRGVKTGTKRGKYRVYSTERKRILSVAEEYEGDWKSAANANGVSIGTAYGWIRGSEMEAEKRGGAKRIKVTQQHVEKMIEYVSENPLITLKEIKDKIQAEYGLAVSTTTIHKHMEGKFYTVKKIRFEPATMNSEENKRKRAHYVTRLMEESGNGKTIVYIDETNCNLFLRRSFGRSRKGTRCTVKLPTSKGKNVHVIGGISQTGLLYFERRRGSFKKEGCQEWLRSLLRSITENLSQIVIVCDNAPVHSNLETVLEEEEFVGATILRLGPYSAPLNPIEECWSVFKAHMKKLLNDGLEDMLTAVPPEGVTQTEYRIQVLEQAIDSSIIKITPTLCMKTCNHVQKNFAACLAMENLNMGDMA
jgi:transposase